MDSLAKDISKGSEANQVDDTTEGDISFSEIFRIFKRRKRFIFTIAFLILGFTGVFNIYQRIRSPLYRGAFQLLISDPINSDTGMMPTENGMIASIAMNETSNDLYTLVEYLKSPVVLDSLASKYSMDPLLLSKRVTISTDPKLQIKGIISISMISANPEKEINLLQDLSETYLALSLKERQKRLADGIDFLNNQAPELEAKKNTLQNKLLDFRRRNSILDPVEEGFSLKGAQIELNASIAPYQKEQARLEEIKNQILQDKLTTTETIVKIESLMDAASSTLLSQKDQKNIGGRGGEQ